MSLDPEPPPRKKVKHYDNGEPHFLKFSCYRRLPLLSKDRTRQWFVEALGEARTIHGFHLWAWVIMPEHVHVLLWPPFHLISSDPHSTRGRVSGGVAGVGAALGETPVGGEVSITGLINGPQANATQLLITGASRWSSPGHPNRLGVRQRGGPVQSVRGGRVAGVGAALGRGGPAQSTKAR